jgi:hypothetical protein
VLGATLVDLGVYPIFTLIPYGGCQHLRSILFYITY